MYHAPAPFYFVKKVYQQLVSGETRLSQMAHDFNLSRSGALVVLRSLQMMDKIAYRRCDDVINIITVCDDNLDYAEYCKVLGVDVGN